MTYFLNFDFVVVGFGLGGLILSSDRVCFG